MDDVLLLLFLCFQMNLSEEPALLSVSFIKTNISPKIVKYTTVSRLSNLPITYQQALKLLIEDQSFRSQFIHELQLIPMQSFYWECPALSSENSKKQFEFILKEANLHQSPTDSQAFHKYFQNCKNNIVTFQNLGGDATLIVPCPLASTDHYGHFAEFLRNAPSDQIHTLLIRIGRQALKNLKDLSPRELIWLSTSGGGVPWLHVRFDSRPKYYNWKPYKEDSWSSHDF
jgi:hypothetical protein